MLAGGMVIAAPSMVPEAAAAGALYVSAENAMFNNHFAGVMVIEVIVKDPARADTDESEGEPTVLVDNMRLRMAQGNDGNWYGYFADTNSVSAHETAQGSNDQLNFGTVYTFGATGQANMTTGITAGANNFTVNGGAVYHSIDSNLDGTASDNFGVIDNPPRLSNWNSSNGATGACDECGQLGLDKTQWPFIQTFNFLQGDFDVILEQAGADEVVRIDHNNEDLDDYASLTLDRSSAPQGAELFLLINDNQLNIDPTDEDVVLFSVNTAGSQTASSVAWSNGTVNYDWLNSGAMAIGTSVGYDAMDRDSHGFGDNGRLSININATESTVFVLEKDSATDDDAVIATTADTFYMIFYEDADNTGTFSNVDNDDNSNLNVVSTAIRGTTATIDYNDSPQSFTVANDFAVIDMDEASVGDEWNSGEVLAVTLTDQDLNLNTWLDEDLTLADPSGQQVGSDLIPSMQIGSPLSLTTGQENSTHNLVDAITNATIQSFSKIGIAITADTDADHTGTLAINTGIAISDLRTAFMLQTILSSIMM
jgi:hypothetical protein